MSLIATLQQHVSEANASDLRQYCELIKLDDPRNFDTLRSVAFKLQKPIEQVAADRTALLRVVQIHGIVGAGRAAAPTIKNAKKAIADFDAETRRINDARNADRANLAGNLSRLLAEKSAAENAIDELDQLRKDHPDILAAEPPIDRSSIE